MVATVSDGGNEPGKETPMPATPAQLAEGPHPPSLGDALDRVYAVLEASTLCYGHGTDNPWDEAVALVLCACEMPAHTGTEAVTLAVSPSQWSQILRWVEARVVQRVPLPYLTGKAWFAGWEFRCDSRALVPRSPLAETVLKEFRPWWQGPAPSRILDLCCGGGAIGIASALQFPAAQVCLADIDSEALALAGENIALHGLTGRVSLHASDLFARVPAQPFDVILCNPPYVNAQDLAEMPAEFHAEPPRGLGAGADGLELAKRILMEAGAHLSEHGVLFLELGNSWESLDALLSQHSLTWLEFENGGHGVLMLRAGDLPPIAQALDSSAQRPSRRV